MGVRVLLTALLMMGVLGCSDSQKQETRAPAQLSPEILKPLLMAHKPDKAISVTEARKLAISGQQNEVIVRGKVPPATLKPFNEGLAVFPLMAPEDLDSPKIKEEFECEDAAT